jgi:hypothetical protein
MGLGERGSVRLGHARPCWVPGEYARLPLPHCCAGYKDPFIPNLPRIRWQFCFDLDRPRDKFVSDIYYTYTINTQACNHSTFISYGRYFLFTSLLIPLSSRRDWDKGVAASFLLPIHHVYAHMHVAPVFLSNALTLYLLTPFSPYSCALTITIFPSMNISVLSSPTVITHLPFIGSTTHLWFSFHPPSLPIWSDSVEGEWGGRGRRARVKLRCSCLG